MFVSITTTSSESTMDKVETKNLIINLAIPIVGGTLGVLVGIAMFIYRRQVEPNAIYLGKIK